MSDLIICVGFFYLIHLFLTMTLSLHKVPFIQWTYVGGDISNMTLLSDWYCFIDSFEINTSIPFVLP